MKWTRGSAIGRGSSATVCLGAAFPSGGLFAVKSAELSRSAFLQKEQRLLSQLCCPRIVDYMGFDITTEDDMPMYNLFMEYVPGGSLHDAVHRRGGALKEPTIQLYTRQILEGLEYLHGKGVVHCDIKSKNILVGQQGLKISDFGVARLLQDPNATNKFPGTPAFMAPEVVRREGQGFPADVWAVGCTVIEMATGRAPWPEADDPVTALYRIGYSGKSPEIPCTLSENAKDFLRLCLQRNPSERWTAGQLLEHPFCNKQLGLDCLVEQATLEFTWDSPTTVLGQGLWDSLERSEAPPPTPPSSRSDSPAERVMGLISSRPGWELDGDWITIRSNEAQDVPASSVSNFRDYEEDLQFSQDVSFRLFSSMQLQTTIDVNVVIRNFQTSRHRDNEFYYCPFFNPVPR